MQNKRLVRWRMNGVNASVHQSIDPNGGDSRSLGKLMQNKRLVRWRISARKSLRA